MPHDCQVLRELVAVFGLQVAAHIRHQLVQAGGQVGLLVRGLLQDDLLPDLLCEVWWCVWGGGNVET